MFTGSLILPAQSLTENTVLLAIKKLIVISSKHILRVCYYYQHDKNILL